MHPLAVALDALVGLLVLVVLVSCLLRANRLDRLHVRTDAARAALVSALERRALVARSAGRALGDEELCRVASRVEQTTTDLDREAVENDLGRLLAALDRDPLTAALRAELTDAEQRVMLARRVHNDAVRDTRALRSRRLVRWFRLAGTASAPTYFEITDPGSDTDGPTLVPPRPRRAARVVLLDEGGRVLLFQGFDPARPQERYWFTPGGGLERGEDARSAAVRELAEETGLRTPADRLLGPVWRRHAVFSFEGDSYAADEEFFLLSASAVPVDTSGFSDLERATVLGHRWWSAPELRDTDAVVYPRQLGALLERVRTGEWDGVTRPIS